MKDTWEHEDNICISYSTNMMGPWFMDWYKKRGLVEYIWKTVESEFVANLRGLNIGDSYMVEEITTHYAGGRIDIYGVPGEHYPLEYGLPVMHGEDWNALSEFLDSIETTRLLEYEELIEMFEDNYGKKIRWANES